MNKEILFSGIKEELFRHLSARETISLSGITAFDVLNEASFCMAVNVLSTIKSLKEETQSNLNSLPKESMDLFYEGINKAVVIVLKDRSQEEHFKLIKERVEFIISSSNPSKIVNDHYNELYGFEGGNVL